MLSNKPQVVLICLVNEMVLLYAGFHCSLKLKLASSQNKASIPLPFLHCQNVEIMCNT